MARTERLLALVNLLRDRKRFRFDQIISRLDISPATLKRDLKFLRERLGTPVEYDAFDRTYQLADSAEHGRRELPGVWFSDSELYALLFAHRLLAHIDPTGRLAPRLRGVIHRIEGLVVTSREDHALVNRVRLIAPGQREVDPDSFAAATQALSQRRRLRMRYHSRARGSSGEREVSPQRLVYHRTWYLDAWCHAANALRRFALDAMESVSVVDASALEVSARDLERMMDGGYGAFAGEARQWATLVFSAGVARWIERENWHPMQRTRLLADGRLELKLPYHEPTELVMDILRHGENVEVVGNPGLRSAIAAKVQALAAVYGAKVDAPT